MSPLPPDDFPALVKFARENQVELTVVGPESPLTAGIVDAFEQAGLRIFGPSKAAAELEGSKVFCKDLLRNADVPSADYQVFGNADDAINFLNDREDVPVVVKADGLAAGKGVVVCSRREEAIAAVEAIARQKVFGAAGNRLVIEERLDGQEASVLAITDGQTIVTLQPAQDHKPAYDGDVGPNTGGMGAYCPAPLVDDEMLHWVEEHILVPTVHAMKRSRRPFRGVLYAGLMMTNQGPKVLEYNVRFGDPECQPLLMRLKTDLLDVLEAAVDGRLDEIAPLEWDPRPAVCVVMASKGYPGRLRQGPSDPRPGGSGQAARREGLSRRHGPGDDGQVVTAGGRVLGRHRPGLDDRQRQAQRLSGGQVHPLGRRLVPQGHFRQGDGEKADATCFSPCARACVRGDACETASECHTLQSLIPIPSPPNLPRSRVETDRR